MRRPISESEVAWLARLLIQISNWLNQILGLDRQGGETDQAGREYRWVEAPKDEVVRVNGLRQATWMLVSCIISYVLVSVQFVLRYARHRGWRFNLWQLALKKIVDCFVCLHSVKSSKESLWAAWKLLFTSWCLDVSVDIANFLQASIPVKNVYRILQKVKNFLLTIGILFYLHTWSMTTV